jgi:hypothetical protein
MGSIFCYHGNQSDFTLDRLQTKRSNTEIRRESAEISCLHHVTSVSRESNDLNFTVDFIYAKNNCAIFSGNIQVLPARVGRVSKYTQHWCKLGRDTAVCKARKSNFILAHASRLYNYTFIVLRPARVIFLIPRSPHILFSF